MASTFNLTNYAANAVASLTWNVAGFLPAATLTIYAANQPASASIAATAANTVLATFTFPAAASNTLGGAGTVTIGNITDTTWQASGTATWGRVTNGGNTLFDGSVDVSANSPDIVINVNPVTSGAVAHVVASPTYTVTQ